MAEAKAKAKVTADDTPVPAGVVVETVSFAGQEIPVDSFFVTPVDRSLLLGRKVFAFKAGEPRQLPKNVILEALGLGVQLAE